MAPVLAQGMALVAEARSRLADPQVSAGLDDAARADLATLLLDLSSALLLLDAAARGDRHPAEAAATAARLDLPEQVAEVLTPALKAGRAPALQVVLLQVASLAAQVLDLLDALAAPDELPEQRNPQPREPAQREKPRRRPEGRPRLHLVTALDQGQPVEGRQELNPNDLAANDQGPPD